MVKDVPYATRNGFYFPNRFYSLMLRMNSLQSLKYLVLISDVPYVCLLPT